MKTVPFEEGAMFSYVPYYKRLKNRKHAQPKKASYPLNDHIVTQKLNDLCSFISQIDKKNYFVNG